MSPSQEAATNVKAIIAEAQKKLEVLKNINPYLIDLSLRENPVGDRIGQTLQNKLDILPKLRAFGFSNILLGTLDYSMPAELEVDDDFMMYLRDHKIDMTGCFAFTDIGSISSNGTFTPSPSMLKLQKYGVPNTLHEIYLAKEVITGPDDLAALLRNLTASINWLNTSIHDDHGGKPRILINIVDGCDAFSDNLDAVMTVLSFLAQQPIEGISIEDDRGTFLPFQVGAYVAAARCMLPAPNKILVHIHAGAGFENSSVIEALLKGADGAWGGLPKSAAVIGHASLGELIANLVRCGNQNMQSYHLNNLLPFATELQERDHNQAVPDDYPILGNNAYRLPLSFFQQKAGRFMDLPPKVIGGKYRYRICPVVSDSAVLAGRLAEVTGKPQDSYPAEVLEQMIRLMRQDLRNGLQIVYDQPAQLLALYERAEEENKGLKKRHC